MQARFHVERPSSVLRHLWTKTAALGQGEFDEAPPGSKGMTPRCVRGRQV